ncbi:hypothetical protein Chor_007562 [Crotalus horridus]
MSNPFAHLTEPLDLGQSAKKFFNLNHLKDTRYAHLPFSIRILLEAAVRNCDEFLVKKNDVENILNWKEMQHKSIEVPFKPARVILQDFTGVPAVVDFAAMRDAVKALEGDPEKINPVCPADLVIDHSIQVDFNKRIPSAKVPPWDELSRETIGIIIKALPDSLQKNQDLEFERNKERFEFLKWGSQAFQNMRIIPPGSGIVHQVNLEYLARVVFDQNGFYYPDSVVGTDSHTTMINGLGVLGWGVGGIEAEAVMLGQPISMVLPEVIGYKLSGSPQPLVTSTDIVLTVTKHLRQVGVVGKFVEFFGPGVAQLSIADRATISNMCPEYGATAAFFPVDEVSIKYLVQTGRDQEKINHIRKYLEATGMFRDFNNSSQDPDFTQATAQNKGSSRLDYSICYPRLLTMAEDNEGWSQKSAGRLKVPPNSAKTFAKLNDINSYTLGYLRHTTLRAGLLAKNAVKAGLTVKPYIKTSLSPGSGVVTYYLRESGVMPYLAQLGFDVVGYGCMTCIGNSGPLPECVVEAITQGDLVAVGVLSGNRNFEGRVHPNTRANYLASPPLVIAYAIAGTVRIDFEKDPLEIFLKDIWPLRDEIQAIERQYVIPGMFKEVYQKIETVNKSWNDLEVSSDKLYGWNPKSTYIKSPPFFENLTLELPPPKSIVDAYVLLNLGDSVTTDHISPAGNIARNSPAARYLTSRGLTPRDFNSYGSRRGNDAVMARGTFANIRLLNKFLKKQAPQTIHFPCDETLDVFDASERYQKDGHPLIILAGKTFQAVMRFDTDVELTYFRNGGILNYMIRKMAS